MDSISKAKKLQAMRKSKLVGSQQSPVGEIYYEYVERSKSLRGVSTHQDKAEENKPELSTWVEQETNIQDKEVVLREEDNEVTELTDKGDKEVHEEVRVEEYQPDEKEINEEEESGLPPEELNRRVEEFIARISKPETQLSTTYNDQLVVRHGKRSAVSVVSLGGGFEMSRVILLFKQARLCYFKWNSFGFWEYFLGQPASIVTLTPAWLIFLP
ncbi:unnamed protein product [Dovyalis caffra]|uniref:Uncharacterized protein n=1 Tax=Dovyalis caffra TaxID=77055 RepID=A0AAV1RHP0_9ROSI|nr:unnamed protein product [Dovyalis caffra]